MRNGWRYILMHKDWKVTTAMREEHFDYHGYMVKDEEVLKWYKKRYSNKAKEKRKNG